MRRVPWPCARRVSDYSAHWAISAAFALTYQGVVARESGNYGQAMTLYADSLALWQQVGDRSVIATRLEGLARATSALGEAACAARLLGAVAALCDHIGAPVPPADQPSYERMVETVRAALQHAFLPAWTAGQAQLLDEVVTEALSVTTLAPQ